ncbi:MAG: hypothetical protein WC551_10555 [Patescibacteria group bacterium]
MELQGMIDDIYKTIAILAGGVIVCGLALWKLIEIVIWLARRFGG